jgi:hypothetical protein
MSAEAPADFDSTRGFSSNLTYSGREPPKGKSCRILGWTPVKLPEGQDYTRIAEPIPLEIQQRDQEILEYLSTDLEQPLASYSQRTWLDNRLAARPAHSPHARLPAFCSLHTSREQVVQTGRTSHQRHCPQTCPPGCSFSGIISRKDEFRAIE